MEMEQGIINKSVVLVFISLVIGGCKTLDDSIKTKNMPIPASYNASQDSTNTAQIKWKDFFTDKNLLNLIDTAVINNQDVQLALQEIEIAKNNVRFRKGFLFPTVRAIGGLGVDKVGRYTSEGAGDEVTEITPGRLVPDPLSDYTIGLQTSWEVDIWGKLHNSKKAAFANYLGSIEGKNFVISNLVAEVANSYYELLALDNQLEIIRETIQLQENALEIVKAQKAAAIVSELAVKQFEAQVLNSQSMEFEILQKITENENKINFLLGRFPQTIVRDKLAFTTQLPTQVKAGIPSQLLANRPDVKRAELELTAAKCDVKAAKAEFYPSLDITGALGFRAFNPSYLFTTPESMVYSLAGDLVAPLINRNAIRAEFNKAKAYQIEALVEYQKTILDGYVEVSNELSNINNLQQAFTRKEKEVDTLKKAIDVANDLFKSARANYLEVLMTQREALESKLELVETKKEQFSAVINIYKALGGGWR